jgi:hypothetical protein
MAHFAQLDKDNIVMQVIVVSNNDALDETAGVAFCQSLFGANTIWKQTSFNTRGGIHYASDNTTPDDGVALRKNYAGVGYVYDKTRDAFYAPSPFPSWKLNEDSCVWEAPTPMPTDGKTYQWVEADLNWQVVTPTVG